MTFPKEKESQEPLTQQLRVLQKAAYEFIDIKKRDRVSWHSIEYIYSYYTKYLWGRNHEYDFEGEILDYLNRQGEATTRMLLQRLRAEMLKIITSIVNGMNFMTRTLSKICLNWLICQAKQTLSAIVPEPLCT